MIFLSKDFCCHVILSKTLLFINDFVKTSFCFSLTDEQLLTNTPTINIDNLMDLDEFMVAVEGGKSSSSEEDRKPDRTEILSRLLASTKRHVKVITTSTKLPTSSLPESKEESLSANNATEVLYTPSKYERMNTAILLSDQEQQLIQQELHEEDPKSRQQQQVEHIVKKRRARGYKYKPKPLQQRPSRSFVPEDMKDQEYWQRRLRNNHAAKKSREERRKRELEVVASLHTLDQENKHLKEKLSRVESRNRLLEALLNGVK